MPAASRTVSQTSQNSQRPRSSRIAGIDAARGLALLGMMAAHILYWVDDTATEPTAAGLLFAGKSSALFATLAGVGLALTTGGTGTRHGPHSGPRLLWDRRYVATRAILLFALGLACGSLDMDMAVILCHYALLFLLALPFLQLGARALGLWAAGWVLFSPLVASALSWVMQRLAGSEQYIEGWRLESNPTFLDLFTQPGVLFWDLLFTGYYPVLQWLGYLLFGLFLGRLALHRLSVATVLAAGGAAMAAVAFALSRGLQALPGVGAALSEGMGVPPQELNAELLTGAGNASIWVQDSPVWFTLATPHSGAPLDLILTCGTSAMVLGICLLLFQAARGVFTWPLLPLVGAGSIPLTIYVGHLVGLAVLAPITYEWTFTAETIAYWVACLVVGALFYRKGWRGPLERLLGQVSGKLVGPRPQDSHATAPGTRQS